MLSYRWAHKSVGVPDIALQWTLSSFSLDQPQLSAMGKGLHQQAEQWAHPWRGSLRRFNTLTNLRTMLRGAAARRLLLAAECLCRGPTLQSNHAAAAVHPVPSAAWTPANCSAGRWRGLADQPSGAAAFYALHLASFALNCCCLPRCAPAMQALAYRQAAVQRPIRQRLSLLTAQHPRPRTPRQSAAQQQQQRALRMHKACKPPQRAARTSVLSRALALAARNLLR